MLCWAIINHPPPQQHAHQQQPAGHIERTTPAEQFDHTAAQRPADNRTDTRALCVQRELANLIWRRPVRNQLVHAREHRALRHAHGYADRDQSANRMIGHPRAQKLQQAAEQKRAGNHLARAIVAIDQQAERQHGDDGAVVEGTDKGALLRGGPVVTRSVLRHNSRNLLIECAPVGIRSYVGHDNGAAVGVRWRLNHGEYIDGDVGASHERGAAGHEGHDADAETRWKHA